MRPRSGNYAPAQQENLRFDWGAGSARISKNFAGEEDPSRGASGRPAVSAKIARLRSGDGFCYIHPSL